MPKRFCNDCETSNLFRLGSIILYLRLHGTYSGRPMQRLTCTCKPLFPAVSRVSAASFWGMGGRVGHPQPARFADDKSRPAAGSSGSGAPPNNQNSQTPSKLEPLRERRSFDSLGIVRRPKETPVSVLEALRSWRYAKAQPTARCGAPSLAAPRSWY